MREKYILRSGFQFSKTVSGEPSRETHSFTFQKTLIRKTTIRTLLSQTMPSWPVRSQAKSVSVTQTGGRNVRCWCL